MDVLLIGGPFDGLMKSVNCTTKVPGFNTIRLTKLTDIDSLSNTVQYEEVEYTILFTSGNHAIAQFNGSLSDLMKRLSDTYVKAVRGELECAAVTKFAERCQGASVPPHQVTSYARHYLDFNRREDQRKLRELGVE